MQILHDLDVLQSRLRLESAAGVYSGDPGVKWRILRGGVQRQPLQYWLFTPELQWRSKGQMAYLTGRKPHAAQGGHQARMMQDAD